MVSTGTELISIITPVLNSHRYIEGCIWAVINQDCRYIEHIIVDGGSSDGTVETIAHYATEYSHIRWISEKDGSQSAAMNKGIALARGEWIGILNADDYYQPGTIPRVIGYTRSLPDQALIVGNCNVWDHEGKLLLVNRPKKMGFTDLLLGQNAHPFPVNPAAYFYDKTLHDRIGLYDVDDHYTMDLDFLLRAVQVAKVFYVDEVWGNFRLHAETKTFQDMGRGATLLRQKELMRKYRKTLPVMKRWKVSLLYAYYNELLGPFHYFQKHPRELPGRIKRRLIRD